MQRTFQMSSGPNSYGSLPERFSWISSYENSKAPELVALDRSMSRFYSGSDPSGYHLTAQELNQNLLDGDHLLQQAAIEAARAGDVVLEFSCGGAAFAPYYERRGARYFGFDVHLPQLPRSDALRVAGSAYSAPIASAIADLVISFYAIEHVSWPAAYLSEMIRVTRPGGRIILAFPDYLVGGGPRLPSVRWGRSHGGIRPKLARGAYTDAVQTYLEQRIVYRWMVAKLRRQVFTERRLRFMIHTSPSCFVAPWSIDTDAIYIASEEEVTLYLSRNGCKIEQRSGDLRDNSGNPLGARYRGHAFISARRTE